MSVETPTYISDFVSTNPEATDTANFGDDHIRNMKAAIKATLPLYTHPVGPPLLVTKSADYTVLSTDEGTIFLVDATSGAKTITLPAASTWTGFRVGVKKIDSSTNTVTVARAGTDTIDGATSYVLSVDKEIVHLESNGSNGWSVVNRHVRLIAETATIAAPLRDNDSVYIIPRTPDIGTITRFSGMISADNTDITMQLRINGVNVTTGSVALTTVDILVTAVPTALNTFTAGQRIGAVKITGNNDLVSLQIDYTIVR